MTLHVYDAQGRLVRTLLEGSLPGDYYSYRWNGNDNSGQAVGSGLYGYRLRAGDEIQTGKMMLVK